MEVFVVLASSVQVGIIEVGFATLASLVQASVSEVCFSLVLSIFRPFSQVISSFFDHSLLFSEKNPWKVGLSL